MYALDLIGILHLDENNLGVDRETFCIYTKCPEVESTQKSKPGSDSMPEYTPNDFLFQEATETEASTSTEIPDMYQVWPLTQFFSVSFFCTKS